MIEIVYEKKLDTHDLSVTGHANYDEYGKDIVCAGVTAITYALACYIADKLDDDRADISMDDGAVYIVCEDDDNIAAAFEMALIGYDLIARKYPEYVALTNMSL